MWSRLPTTMFKSPMAWGHLTHKLKKTFSTAQINGLKVTLII